jgi:hypothetical protein
MDRLIQESIFQDVTAIEEMLVARAFPFSNDASLLYLFHGNARFKGNVVNLPQNIENLANSLPHNAVNLPITLMVRKTNIQL